MRFRTILKPVVMCILVGIFSRSASAALLFPLIDDPNANGAVFDNTNLFADPPAFFVDETAMVGANNIVAYTMNGIPTFNGGGFTIPVSNGENGIDSTDGGANIDNPNTGPVNSAIAALGNPSGKLANGNAIRLSVWMRQDPADPVTLVPQIEPVLKIELWKEAFSGFADFNGAPFPGAGDRIWDTDQNAGDSFYTFACGGSCNQSQASWVDMDNSGTTSFGKPVARSLVTDEWRLVETTLRLDDDPANDGIGWSIGSEGFTVADVEEVRGVMFFGDFLQTNLTNAGSFWVDNILMEVFATEAEMIATPNPNPMPIDTPALTCDFDGSQACDIADLDLLYDNLGGSNAPFDLDGSGQVNNDDVTDWLADASANDAQSRVFVRGDSNLDGAVGGSDFTALAGNFGNSGGWSDGNFVVDPVVGGGTVGGPDFTALASSFGHVSPLTAVPEPSVLTLLGLSLVTLVRCIRRRSQR